MALIDIGSPTLDSLLNPQQQQQVRGQSLLGLGAGLLAGGATPSVGGGFGQALAAGAQGFQQARQQELENIRAQQQEQRRIREQNRGVQRSVYIPGKGFVTQNRDGGVDFNQISIEAQQAFIESQKKEVEQTRDLEAARLLEQSRNDFKLSMADAARTAAEAKPKLDRLLQLAKTMETVGSFADARVAAKKFLGRDVASEEEFKSLSFERILDAAKSLKGALSESENAYIEGVSPNINRSRKGNVRIINNLIKIAESATRRQKRAIEFIKGGGDPSEFDYNADSAVLDDTPITEDQKFTITPVEPPVEKTVRKGRGGGARQRRSQTFQTSTNLQFTVEDD